LWIIFLSGDVDVFGGNVEPDTMQAAGWTGNGRLALADLPE
jgi:hypothetical protein